MPKTDKNKYTSISTGCVIKCLIASLSGKSLFEVFNSIFWGKTPNKGPMALLILDFRFWIAEFRSKELMRSRPLSYRLVRFSACGFAGVNPVF
jgi:hypothetical protein